VNIFIPTGRNILLGHLTTTLADLLGCHPAFLALDKPTHEGQDHYEQKRGDRGWIEEKQLRSIHFNYLTHFLADQQLSVCSNPSFRHFSRAW